MQEPYVPRGDCKNPMNPDFPQGCPSGFEPYVHRTNKMVETGDTFDPCCKQTGCDPSDAACIQKIDNRWTARVLKFSDTAQYLISKLSQDVENINTLVSSRKDDLTAFFQANKDIHETATAELEDYFKITAVIIRDLERCTGILTAIVDDDKRIAKAAVTPHGRAFDVMRAEAVGSGCASLESLLAIARTEYYPRYDNLAQILNDAIGGYRRTTKMRASKHGIGRTWNGLVDKFVDLKSRIQKVGLQTFSFYVLTVIPFLYTTIFAMGTAVPAMLLANDKLTMLTRSLKLFCHLTQLPGLMFGLGVVLSNKLLVYLRHRQNNQRINDEVAKGAVTFFSLLEKMVIHNPTAAAAIATTGALKAGSRAVAFTAKVSSAAIASLGNNPQIGFLCQILQGILLFFMSMLSSSIWKAIGFACKTTVKVAAPTVEATSAIVGGTATLVGGFAHLTTQMFSAAGQTVGYGLGQVGTAADMLGDKLGSFMDSFHVDAAVREKMMSNDAALEGTLSTMNSAILRILGVTAEGINTITLDNMQTAFDSKNVDSIEQFIRTSFETYKVELQLVMMLLPIIYGTWTYFQPKTQTEGLSTLVSEGPDVDWSVRKPTEYVNRYGRIIPRPPINFVFQQCLHEDPDRMELCKARAEEWSGVKADVLPERFQAVEDKPPRYRGSSRRRRRGSRRH